MNSLMARAQALIGDTNDNVRYEEGCSAICVFQALERNLVLLRGWLQ